jgi:hypothetical protein
VLKAASGALLLLLGVAVALLKPRTRVSLALATFSGCLGATFVLANLYGGAITRAPEEASRQLAANLFRLAAVGSLLFLSVRFPMPLRRAELRLVALPLAVAAVVFVLLAEVNQSHLATLGPSQSVLIAALFFTLTLLALRYPGATSRQRRQLVLMSLALVVYPAAYAGEFALHQSNSPLRFVGLAAVGLVSALWLANTRVSGATSGARNVALAGLGIGLVGLAYATALGGFRQADQSGGLPGVARTLTVLLLAYAILRGQLLDIDVKIKWGIRRGTLAAIFVGVFFVVSQIAQNYFAQYGVLAGGVAAGVLLFGLSPLQRLAERVADRAMPGVKSAGEMSHPERVALYRSQAQAAWEDGNMTRDERRLLDRLQQNLGLTREEASRLESEVAHGA